MYSFETLAMDLYIFVISLCTTRWDISHQFIVCDGADIRIRTAITEHRAVLQN